MSSLGVTIRARRQNAECRRRSKTCSIVSRCDRPDAGSSSRRRSPSSIATGQAGRRRVGAGPRGEVPSPPLPGLPLPAYSPGTRRISAITTKHMARLERSSDHDMALDIRDCRVVRGRGRCRDGAPDRSRQHRRIAEADGCTRGRNGGHNGIGQGRLRQACLCSETSIGCGDEKATNFFRRADGSRSCVSKAGRQRRGDTHCEPSEASD